MSAAAVEIFCGEALAKIALRGAELKSWAVAGQELIWPGDEKFWAELGPDPVSRRWLDPRRHSRRGAPHAARPAWLCARAGFFEVTEQAENRVVLRLAANPATRALYPFEFSLYVEYDT